MGRQVFGVEKTVLRGARETAGLAPKAVAAVLKRDVAEVLAWEAGKAAPTYPQLEKLAYVVYKRPLAAFFLPSPPAGGRPRAVAARCRVALNGVGLKVLNEARRHAREYEPDRVSAPGGSLRDLLRERMISPSRLAQRMGRSVREISEILRGVRAIDRDTARGLEGALGTPAQFWLNRERRYRDSLAERAASSWKRA